MIITIKSGNFYKVKAKNLTFVADNLGYHSVFGFNKSFSQRKVCEKCTIPQSMFKLVFEVDESQLGLSTGVKKDALTKKNGLKRVCELETNFFAPYQNFTADLHHDIFQGSLMKVVRVVLYQLIPEYFDINKLNSRISNFGYGRDIDVKPSEFDYERIKNKSSGPFKPKI